MLVGHSPTATSAAGRRRPVGEWPGIRTFKSERFRMAVAATLVALAVALLTALIARQAADPAGQYGIDMLVYQQAARDIAAGLSPYPSRFLDGPVAAQEMGLKFSPAFAQAFLPLAHMSVGAATTVWVLVQATLMFAGVWLAASYGGAKRSVERLLWTGVAVAFYLPVWDSLWKGNVSDVQAFLIALVLSGNAVAGSALTTAVLLKTTPFALVPAVLARGGRLLRSSLISGAMVIALSVALSPHAWIDFVLIQPNLFAGGSTHATNLMPSSIAAVALPQLPLLASALRALTLAVGLVAVVEATRRARSSADAWPGAVALGVVGMLLIPASAWYHYLALLLPLAAFAWPRASSRTRSVLLLGSGSVTAGLAWLPLATLGAVVLAGATLGVILRPQPKQARG